MGPFGNVSVAGIAATLSTDQESSMSKGRDTSMIGRLRGLGLILAVFGLLFMAGGAYAFIRTQEGIRSLQAFSTAQDIKLSYNEQGVLVDRGEPAGAQSILALLREEWGYPVVAGDLNPNDPLVNTPTEYMYQMATVAYHTLNGTQTIVLDEQKEYKGEVFPAGEYEFAVDGRYWTDFDRQHPIEGPARDKAWTGTAHALIANLGVGTVTASTLQMGFGLAGLFAGIGFTVLVAGLGLVWATRAAEEKAPKRVAAPQPMPA
jgi:hypothetical protein